MFHMLFSYAVHESYDENPGSDSGGCLSWLKGRSGSVGLQLGWLEQARAARCLPVLLLPHRLSSYLAFHRAGEPALSANVRLVQQPFSPNSLGSALLRL